MAFLSAVTYLAVGIIGFHYFLELTWPSAFYLAVQTSLTVGFGDICGAGRVGRHLPRLVAYMMTLLKI